MESRGKQTRRTPDNLHPTRYNTDLGSVATAAARHTANSLRQAELRHGTTVTLAEANKRVGVLEYSAGPFPETAMNGEKRERRTPDTFHPTHYILDLGRSRQLPPDLALRCDRPNFSTADVDGPLRMTVVRVNLRKEVSVCA